MPLTLPYAFAGVGLKTPSARLDANFQALADWLNTHGAVTGLIEARPAPTSVGALYVAVDQNDLWYMADGTAWPPVGRALDGTLDVDPVTGVLRLFSAVAGTDAQRVLAAPLATGVPTSSPPDAAQLYVADMQGQPARAAWHQRTEDGWAAPLDRLLHRVVGNPVTTVVNTAVETSLVSVVLKGRTLTLAGGDGLRPRGVELVITLDSLNNSGASRTLTLRVKYGGQTAVTAVLTLPSSGTRRKGVGIYRLDPSPTGQAPTEVLYQWEPTPTEVVTLAGTTVDATADQPLEVTAQVSVAASALDARLFGAHVRLI